MVHGEQLRAVPIIIHVRIVQLVVSVRIRLKNVQTAAILVQPMCVPMVHGAVERAAVQNPVMVRFAVNVKTMLRNVRITAAR